MSRKEDPEIVRAIERYERSLVALESAKEKNEEAIERIGSAIEVLEVYRYVRD